MVKVNLKDGKIQVIASESGKPVVAPDGMTWVPIDMYGLQIYTQGLKSYRINVPNEQGYSCFSPDSSFMFYILSHRAQYRLISIRKPSEGEEPYNVQNVTLSPISAVPEGKDFRGAYFTNDGMHPMLAFDDKKINNPELSSVPWLRLSWDYEIQKVPNQLGIFTEIKKETETKNQEQQDGKKKKGFFSRLFG